MNSVKTIALCGMMTALSVVILLLGGVLELGMYAAPMIAGFCIMYIGHECGAKNQWLVWAAVSLLSFMLVPNVEENLMYACFFGLYPILRPHFQKLPRLPRRICKLLYFNIMIAAVETLIMRVLAPESMGVVMMIVLLMLGNVIFRCYDFLIPRSQMLFQRYASALKKR